MDIWKSFLQILDAEMTLPQPYGWFHLLCLGLTILATIYLCFRGQYHSSQQIRSLVLGVTLTTILLEIYKQINYTFTVSGDTIIADYQWYAFPWQFCSMPMYVGLLAGLTKKGRLHEAACAFLATFSVFAGVCVMLYPVSIFTETAGINIQTSFCHGSMIVVGAYLLATGYVKMEYRTILKALPVFITAVFIAVVLNELAYYSGLLQTDEFNMFFVSRHCPPHLPVYSLVQNVVPYPWCLILYILGFTAASSLILLVAKGIQTINLRPSRTVHTPQSFARKKAHI